MQVRICEFGTSPHRLWCKLAGMSDTIVSGVPTVATTIRWAADYPEVDIFRDDEVFWISRLNGEVFAELTYQGGKWSVTLTVNPTGKSNAECAAIIAAHINKCRLTSGAFWLEKQRREFRAIDNVSRIAASIIAMID